MWIRVWLHVERECCDMKDHQKRNRSNGESRECQTQNQLSADCDCKRIRVQTAYMSVALHEVSGGPQLMPERLRTFAVAAAKTEAKIKAEMKQS